MTDGARGRQRAPDGTRECQRMPEWARWCQWVPDGARGRKRVPDGARECQRMPEWARWRQWVPEGGKGCQKDQIGPVVAPGLGKKTDLIFVTVSIAGVEVVAMVDTGAKTSCCRWEWYQKWKDHLGAVIKSKVRVMGVAPDPIKVKGLTKPLTLHWDGVGGKFQLMVLPTIPDVDVVLGVDILSQFNVNFDCVKQVVNPYREPCTPVASAKNVGLLLENPDSTFKGKIPVKEEGVKEVAKDILRPAYQDIYRFYYASNRKRKTKEKKEDHKIVWESSMPWNQADYKVQLKKDLEDIRQKLGQILGQDLGRKTSSFAEATLPSDRIEEGILVDLCVQRSEERGSGCDAPAEISKWPTSSDGACEFSEGLLTPVTPSLRPPKPQRTKVRKYTWRDSGRKDVCMFIRILKSSKPTKRRRN